MKPVLVSLLCAVPTVPGWGMDRGAVEVKHTTVPSTVGAAEEIRARVAAFQSTVNSHDPSAVAAFFTEDADLVVANRPALRGRPAIEDWWREHFARQKPERRATFVITSLRLVVPDIAVIDAVMTSGGEDLSTAEARGTFVFRRQEGDWLIAAMRGLPTEEGRVVLNASLETAQALRPDIRIFVEAYEDAFDSHDPAVLSALYREDADIIVRDGPAIRGAQAIREWWEAYFSQPRPYRVILVIDEIRMLNPDVALLNLTATGAAEAAGGRLTPTRKARATWLIVREAGAWRIAALRVLPSEEDQVLWDAEQ